MPDTDTCDRCCQRSVAEWWHPTIKGTLALCGHHCHEQGAPLVADGWVSIYRWQALPPVTADAATH